MPSKSLDSGERVLAKLEQLRLLRPTDSALRHSLPEDESVLLLRLCAREALVGGISVDFGVRPDELIGPLLSLVSGSARELRVLDSLSSPIPELIVSYRGQTHRWHVVVLQDLIRELNRLFHEDPFAGAIAVLGEWDEMLQLWCLGKSQLAALMKEDFFRAENRSDLSTVLQHRVN